MVSWNQIARECGRPYNDRVLHSFDRPGPYFPLNHIFRHDMEKSDF